MRGELPDGTMGAGNSAIKRFTCNSKSFPQNEVN